MVDLRFMRPLGYRSSRFRLLLAGALAALAVGTPAADDSKAAASASVVDPLFRDSCSALDENPARGAAPGGWHVLRPSGNASGHPRGFCSWLWNIGAFSAGNELYKGGPRPACVGGTDLPLTVDALAAVSNTLVNARASGAVMVIRFGYTSGSESGAEPENFDMLLGHIRQLGPILGAFPDVVLAVECGMTGPWGEMHSTYYREPTHVKAMGEAWLTALAPPTALLVRYPKWVLDYADQDVEPFLASLPDGAYWRRQPAQRRIGIFNDGYLGTDSDYGTWRHHPRWMVREQGVRYLEARRNVPYGGELAHISPEEAAAVPLFDRAQFNIVEEFYRTHLSYLRNIDTPHHNLAAHIGTLKLTHAYDFPGMPNLSEWYGCDLRTFMRTHMGYRFVIRGITPARGEISVAIENTGFGHLLIKSRGTLTAGGRSARVPLDLRTLRPGETRAYRLPVPRDFPGGAPLLLGVRLDTPAAQAVHFANDALREGDAVRLTKND